MAELNVLNELSEMDKTMLNQDIMGCQGILDDLRALTWRLDDRRVDFDSNDLADVVRGLETLYEIKFMKLWDSYNAVTKHIK